MEKNMSTERNNTSFTEGSIVRALVNFMLPVLGALALQAAYGAVDLMIVGHFGNSASISAVAVGSTLMHMVTVVIVGLSMGGTVAIGQYIGNKKPEKAGDVIGTLAIFLTVVGAALTITLEVYAGDLLRLLNVPDDAYDKAMAYVQISVAGTLVVIAYNVISGVLRGIGNSKLPLIFVGIASVINVAGDLLLVGVFNMDAAGAAIATVFAQLMSVVMSIYVLKRQKLPVIFNKSKLRINGEALKKILGIGVPIALQDLMIQVSFLVISAVINEMGTDQSAGYGVAQKVIAFIMLVPSAIMQSVAAIVAQNIGAGKKDRAKKSVLTAMGIGSAIGVFVAIMGFFFGDVLSMIFTSEKAVIRQSASYLKAFSIESMTTCILFSCIGYYNGRGISLPVMLQGITSALFVRIPTSVWLSTVSTSTLIYVGFAVPITTAYGLIFFAVCFLIEWLINKKKIKNQLF